MSKQKSLMISVASLAIAAAVTSIATVPARPGGAAAGAGRAPAGGAVTGKAAPAAKAVGGGGAARASHASGAGIMASAGAQQLCGYNIGPVRNGAYTVQNNEWGSSQKECVTTGGASGGAAFQVSTSAMSNPTKGPPGGYPSIYAGCHWGQCTAGGLARTPLPVSDLTPGRVTSTLVTTTPPSGAYDVAYDIWVNQAPTTKTEPNGTEVMVWLNHAGGVQPAGSVVARNVLIGGHTYDVWYAKGTSAAGGTVTFNMTTPTAAVFNLDIGQLVQSASTHGWANRTWYLIDVEAGFELWQGGAGLAVNDFSVALGTRPFVGTPPVSIGPPGMPARHS
ncbi:MAG TPA: hypothetical protein VH478_09715 [Trebonia sp.]|jgi:cellulose 1,4-beta-cellobiosidase|nr:hypothetical protein [Trebonia sp.]